jgi:hypothetical protein
MTHITFGLFRKGVREPGLTLSGMGPDTGAPVSPYNMASAAISRHHRESPQAAEQHLHRTMARSDYWGPSGHAPARGWAEAIRDCYARYRAMTANDQRAVFAYGLNRQLDLAPHDLSVHIDVVLLDPRGYVARVVLWDPTELTPDKAQLYAAPVWRVLEEELGAGRVAGVEVWHLRTGRQLFVDAAAAAQRLPAVTLLVGQIAS